MKLPLSISLRLFESPTYRCIRTLDRRLNAKTDIGIGLLRRLDKNVYEEVVKSRSPTLDSLGVQTHDKIHSFNVPCDRVIKFIKLGAINKTIALQYCHYLAELTRNSQHEDHQYYAKRCIDIMTFLLRQYKDMPPYAKTELLCDISNTSSENCKLVRGEYLDDDQIVGFNTYNCAEIMKAYYKFQLWDEAQSMISKNNPLFVNVHTIQSLVDAVQEASNKYREMGDDSDAKQKLRDKVLNHLMSVFERCLEYRIHFVTKNKSDFIKALEDFDLKVQINPTIKMTGRCTSCNSKIPMFDNNVTKTINKAISEQIMKGSDKGLYINAAPNDTRRFEAFLQDIFKRDKKPIDCVIDGLNVAYKNSVGFKFITRNLNEDLQKTFKIQNPENQARVLINIIIRGNFLRDFKKILVIGKHHMTKWPGLMDFFEKHNIHYFSSYNNSKDDLFQLFASTLSPSTLFVTNDFLRDHLAQLDSKNRMLLERWIDTHQIWISHKTLKPIWPTPYEKIASTHRETGCFHVPIIDGNMIDEVGVTEPPPHLNSKMLTWLCCQSCKNHDETQEPRLG